LLGRPGQRRASNNLLVMLVQVDTNCLQVVMRPALQLGDPLLDDEGGDQEVDEAEDRLELKVPHSRARNREIGGVGIEFGGVLQVDLSVDPQEVLLAEGAEGVVKLGEARGCLDARLEPSSDVLDDTMGVTVDEAADL